MRSGASLHRDLHRVAVAQPGAGHQRVLHVALDAVVVAQHGGDAALRVLGGALGRLALGEDHHRAVGGGLQGEGEPRDPAAEDEEVEVRLHTLTDHSLPVARAPTCRRRPAGVPGPRRLSRAALPGSL